MKNGAAYSHEQKIAIIQEHIEHHRTLKEICSSINPWVLVAPIIVVFK